MSTIKERPILFSGPMVRALLAGTKTQTRRVVKAAPGNQSQWLTPELLHSAPEAAKVGFTLGEFAVQFTHPKGGPLGAVICPYGAPGDRLWVRETLFFSTCEEAWCYQADNQPVWADRPDDVFTAKILYGDKPVISSIHMPREVSRILLEIVSVRVERLQDISEADAQAEGAERGILRPYGIKDWQLEHNQYASYKEGFQYIWHTVNGPDSWQANPWVWVVTFRRIDA